MERASHRKANASTYSPVVSSSEVPPQELHPRWKEIQAQMVEKVNSRLLNTSPFLRSQNQITESNVHDESWQFPGEQERIKKPMVAEHDERENTAAECAAVMRRIRGMVDPVLRELKAKGILLPPGVRDAFDTLRALQPDTKRHFFAASTGGVGTFAFLSPASVDAIAKILDFAGLWGPLFLLFAGLCCALWWFFTRKKENPGGGSLPARPAKPRRKGPGNGGGSPLAA